MKITEVLFNDWHLRGIYVNGEFHNKTAMWWVKHECDVPTEFWKEFRGATMPEASTETTPGFMYTVVNGKLKLTW